MGGSVAGVFWKRWGTGLYTMPADRPNLPFMYTLRAVKE